MHRGFYSILVCTLLLQSTLGAQASSYYIVLNSYFSFIPALPIAVPQNEQAGDVYLRPGVIYARKTDCFKEIVTDTSETYFPRSIAIGSSDLGIQVAREDAVIAKAAADAGAKVSTSVDLSYGENGKAKWSQLVQKDILASLQNSNGNECRDRILRQLRSAPDSIASVPWIIQSVWYATINLSYRTTSAVDAAAKAKIDGRLTSLEVSGAVNTQQNSDSLVIAYTGKRAFPVAWRPAFISLDNYLYINELMDQGWFR